MARLLTTLALTGLSAAQLSSSKRGLVFVPDDDHASDNFVWTQPGSDLTWYYNYQSKPSPAYADVSQDDFEFVPMMWGVNPADPEETTFHDEVVDLIENKKINITRVLGFNEPDGTTDQGGSNVAPALAARAWVANFEPLAERGIQLGMPACTGGWGGLPWLKQFLGNCSEIVSRGQDEKKNCTWDFLPVHWYDNFEGLASHIGERRATWPDAEIWITEYAYAHQDLTPTQEFYNQSADYFDKEDWIGRYTYFGAFRSDVSNVGPNAPFLNNDGDLTDVGSWYLGMKATGVDPQSGMAAGGRRLSVVGMGVAFGLMVLGYL